jgi:hypothetical protein
LNLLYRVEYSKIEESKSGTPNLRVVYSRRGKYIFSGNSKGKILIVDSASLEVKSSFKVTQTAAANNAVKVSYNVYIWLGYLIEDQGQNIQTGFVVFNLML